MLRLNCLTIAGFACVLAAQAGSTGWAQDESREDRFFRYLDRNNDGVLAGEELSNLDDRMRERFREAGLDTRRDVRRDDFVKRMAERSSRDGRDRDSGDRDRGSSRGSSGSSKPAPPPPLILKLPANYTALDKNADNQIGMYEWDRTKLSEFLALDRNGDGFITAKELAHPRTTEVASPPPSGVAAPNVTVIAPGGTGGTFTVATGTPGAAPVVTLSPAATTVTVVAATPAAEESPETRRAKYFFSITDKDKNGEISAEEWAASRGVRVMFEKANRNPTFPLKDAVFVEHFLALQAK